jgi:flagellum-specific ATP synthase
MPRLVDPAHGRAARKVRALLAAYEDARDLINIGAYVRGSSADVDAAIELMPQIRLLTAQDAEVVAPFDQTVAALLAIAGGTQDVYDGEVRE